MEKNKINIACVQETKIRKNLDYRTQNGYRILSTAATSEKNGSPEGGVAIIVSGELAPMIKNVKRHDERVIQVTLQNSPYDIPVNILSIYAPHNGHAVEKRRLFWKNLNKYVEKYTKKESRYVA